MSGALVAAVKSIFIVVSVILLNIKFVGWLEGSTQGVEDVPVIEMSSNIFHSLSSFAVPDNLNLEFAANVYIVLLKENDRLCGLVFPLVKKSVPKVKVFIVFQLVPSKNSSLKPSPLSTFNDL